MSVKALVITGFGLNCEWETTTALERVGATVEQLHLNRLIDEPERLMEFQLLAFIGGFSFGDHLGAGTVFANRVKARLGEQLAAYIADGRLVIGICNGFQTLTRLGLVPALNGPGFDQQVALAQNDQGLFRDAWVTLRCNPDSPCVFTRGIDMLPLPIRHGEGKFVCDAAVLEEIERRNLVVMRYACPDRGTVAEGFPDNPNGSLNAIAGICDPTGRVFGLMPHPEGYGSPLNHPHWTRQKINGVLPEEGLGLQVFRNAVAFAEAELA